MYDLAHFHTFKCGGTTIASIVERNFPSQVRFVESHGIGQRLPWERAAIELDPAGFRAISSHLLTIPPAGSSFAKLNVGFLRRPRSRLISAYESLVRHAEEGRNISFEEFIGAQRPTITSNFMTRHLSPQGQLGWILREGWGAFPEDIDLDRDDLFLGVLEHFDISMVLMERRLQAFGVAFDGSYPVSQNVGGYPMRSGAEIPIDMVELDEALYHRVVVKLLDDWRRQGSEEALAQFRNRCAERAISQAIDLMPAVEDWTRI